MLTRKLAKLVRGKATPFQVASAAVLGSLLGFLPGFLEAPGSMLFLLALLAILNANVFVAAVVGTAAKLLSLALPALSFGVGRFLLDGPTSGLFRAAINAPVLAYFGLERYVTTGGLALGLVFGLVSGIALARLQQKIRRTLAAVQSDPERYERVTSKRWARIAIYVFFGKRPKKSYADLGTRRVGNPVRVAGLVGVVALAGVGWALHGFLTSAYLQNALHGGLERWNGATVDLDGFQLDLSDGRMQMDALAMADRDDLATDVFRGRGFEANLATTDILRKRLVVERLVISEAASGVPRSSPGERVERGRGEEPSAVDEAEREEGSLSLEDVLADVEVWKGRLTKLRGLLERLDRGDDAPSSGELPGAADESLRERLERRARELGHASVIATHLIDGAPRFLLQDLTIEGLTLASVPDEVFDVSLQNVSSAPAQLEQGARLAFVSRSGRVRLEVDLGERDGLEAARRGSVRFAMKGFDVDRLASGLVVRGEHPIAGGTLDVELDGGWQGGTVGRLDLPLAVTLHDSLLTLPGTGSTRVERFALPIGVRGAIDAPALSIDDETLIDALLAAGKDELAGRLRDEVDARLAAARAELAGKLAEQGLDLEGLEVPDAEALKELAQSKVEEAKDEVTEKAKDAATEKAGEEAAGALRGLLGGKKP